MWSLAKPFFGIQKSKIVCSALRLTKESLGSRKATDLVEKKPPPMRKLIRKDLSNNCWPQCLWDPTRSNRRIINVTAMSARYKIGSASSWNWQKLAAEQLIKWTSYQAFILHKSRIPCPSPSAKLTPDRGSYLSFDLCGLNQADSEGFFCWPWWPPIRHWSSVRCFKQSMGARNRVGLSYQPVRLNRLAELFLGNYSWAP